MPPEQTTVDETTTTLDSEQVEANNSSTITDAEAKIAELTAQLEKQNSIVEAARKAEKYTKSKASTEQKTLQAQLDAEKARADALETKFRNHTSDVALRQVLAEQGAKAVDTALKLVDRSTIKFNDDGSVDVESIKTIVAGLKTSDSILFDATQTETTNSPAVVKPSTPPPVRATESDTVMGFNAEIKNAKTQAELQAVLRKYGK